jgi:hypothetical protein
MLEYNKKKREKEQISTVFGRPAFKVDFNTIIVHHLNHLRLKPDHTKEESH